MPNRISKRERVLRAAESSFRSDGYRSSVDGIARRAGVAKQTVYHYFPSKDDLFKEVTRGYAHRLLVELHAGLDDVRGALLGFALAYRKRVLSAEAIAMFRTLAAETPRFRPLARAVYSGGAGETLRGLAAWLAAEMSAGRLRCDDPQFAAELLLGMLVGQDRVKRLYGFARNNAADEMRRTTQIVDCFLRAYSTERHR